MRLGYYTCATSCYTKDMLIAVDTGGTKTLVARYSRDGAVQDTVKFPTSKDFSAYFSQLCQTITQLTGGEAPAAIAIAVPGPVQDGHTLTYAQNIGWERNINFKTLLEKQFACPVVVENDANLAGIAEIRALSHTPTVGLYITVSTGIGTGLIIDGQLQPIWSQSEGGNILLEHDGVMKTWEQFASGSAIYARYGKYGKDITSQRIWRQIATDISRGIVALCPVLRPEIIVIGGSMGTHFKKYERYLIGILKEQLQKQYIPTIKQAQHPEEAVIYGCYYYAIDSLSA